MLFPNTIFSIASNKRHVSLVVILFETSSAHLTLYCSGSPSILSQHGGLVEQSLLMNQKGYLLVVRVFVCSWFTIEPCPLILSHWLHAI